MSDHTYPPIIRAAPFQATAPDDLACEGAVDLPGLAASLEAALLPVDDDGPRAWIVRLASYTSSEPCGCGCGAPLNAEIGLLPVDLVGGCPVDALAGFVAPDDWRALGVVATATAWYGDQATPRRLDRPDEPGEPVLLVLLVERSGRAVTLLSRLDGGGPLETAGPLDGPEGLLLDLCRRAFGLPTPPPDQPPVAWWAQLWLDAVLQDVADAPNRSWAWSSLVRLHPLHDLIDPEADADAGPATFAAAVEVVLCGYGWEHLRHTSLAGPARDVAEWMDEGCFSRWSLGARPDISELLAALRQVLPGDASDALAATLDRWGVQL